MIQQTNWRKLRLRCAQVTSTRPALASNSRTIKITSLVYDIRTPVYPFLHVHSEYELIVYLDVDESSGEQSREHHIERGHTLLFSPQTQHTGHIAETSCQVFVVRFSMDPAFATPLLDPWPLCPELADDAERLSQLLMDANPGDLAYASASLFMIVLRALSLFTPEKHSIKPIARKLNLPEEILQMVLEDPTRQLTVEDIASHFGMSARHLSRSFHSETKEAIISYIVRTRLNIAQTLLRESDRKISDICARVGIPDLAYFCRCFRQYFGSTPSEYRKMFRQGAISRYQEGTGNGK